jgi:hypothetical protein
MLLAHGPNRELLSANLRAPGIVLPSGGIHGGSFHLRYFNDERRRAPAYAAATNACQCASYSRWMTTAAVTSVRCGNQRPLRPVTRGVGTVIT